MPEIDGITFDEQAYRLIDQLIDALKKSGHCDVYGLPRMHAGRGEVRLAHYRPDTKRKNAKGVFGRFMPTARGVTFVQRKDRTPITTENLDSILQAIDARREAVKSRLRTSEKVYPQPGMVSGGQFGSDRSKH